MNKSIYGVALVIILTALVSGCGESHPAAAGEPEAVTYTAKIQQIIAVNCLNCHSVQKVGISRYGAPLGSNYDTYEDVLKQYLAMNALIQTGLMPPGDSGLTPADRKAFQDWIDGGKLK